MMWTCILLLFESTKLVASIRAQSIAVKERPFSWLDPDDVLDESYSDIDGRFHLSGATEELTAIEPVLEIYHDCNDGVKTWNPTRKKARGEDFLLGGLAVNEVHGLRLPSLNIAIILSSHAVRLQRLITVRGCI
ncbi:unnamed protein product [Heligmosomoides polygyrus]|uniref:Transthyretin-like family protein n=1 Tax=Heligmosomoides polygyrus TaxID=6339 RepID=A0A183G4V0_HELPZ|nr:unnamed protein product [Heligmosomoides polygyrus]